MQKPVYYATTEDGDYAFAVSAAAMKFGAGVLAELGDDARGLGLQRVALFIDRQVAVSEPAEIATASLKKAGIDAVVYDEITIEPTDASFLAAADFARDGRFDGFVSLGGGSTMDTAKAANLYATHPADFLAYVNLPYGEFRPVPGPLKPHIACPTTSGTGSETTSTAVMDIAALKVKTAISNRMLKPTLALVDPTTTRTLPAGVVASTGFDVLTHAIESYTARPYTTRPRPNSPDQRPVFQGANPYSDVGSLEAVRLGGKYLVRAVEDADDHEARHMLMLAATMAGLSFGNAGVHLPHAMSYGIAGLCHTWRAKGYEKAQPMVPHGIAVVLNAPAAFRFTASAAPDRHLAVAEALGADVRNATPEHGGELLAARLTDMMRRTGLPNGTAELGFTESDIPDPVERGYNQPRLLVLAPREVTRNDVADMYRGGLRYW
ncbi:MAG: hydroxyacid-oxoacid transhydrogenase [Rhodospirillales bacterium]|jgi:alcohol dehydrogenase class IV|nr:hydroxyacid-oxoacid transhydrogenase [Rhodospirillales bacterium]